jgi:4-hydroxyproline epimerase
MSKERRLRVIDSHTGGEPTRVVVEGGPDLGGGTVAELRERLAKDFDWVRSACVNEPRGHDALVGALLCEPSEPDCAAGVIFFNNVGVLHGCGHGTIGVAVTLARMGRISYGQHRIETSTGVVTVDLQEHGQVTVSNVRSYRHAKDVEVTVPEWGEVRGDVAWGGNWFFLIDGQGPEIELANVEALTSFTWAVREALVREGINGADGMEIDHIEVFGPPTDRATADSRNFVLCPGKEYDRSPCGTGTSAKLACLYADGKLKEDEEWTQAGILNSAGGCFEKSGSIGSSCESTPREHCSLAFRPGPSSLAPASGAHKQRL